MAQRAPSDESSPTHGSQKVPDGEFKFLEYGALLRSVTDDMPPPQIHDVLTLLSAAASRVIVRKFNFCTS